MNKDIKNVNDKGQFHGYQEWYWMNELEVRVNIKNGVIFGYQEWHFIKQTNFYI